MTPLPHGNAQKQTSPQSSPDNSAGRGIRATFAALPELPEVETVRLGLQGAMEGARFDTVALHRADLRFPFQPDFTERLTGQTVTVPADISSAAFPMVAAIIVPGSRVLFREVGIYEKHGQLDGVWRDVVIVEDIVDTGLTLTYLQEILGARSPRNLRTACLLSKPSRRTVDAKVEYIGFTIEDRFVVG